MATGKLTLYPHSIRGFPLDDYPESMLAVFFSVTREESRNTRPSPAYNLNWDVALDLFVPEGKDTLTIRLQDGTSDLHATAEVALDQIFIEGSDSRSIPLQTDGGRSLGKLELAIKFEGTL